MTEREQDLSELAQHFASYLEAQTSVTITIPQPGDREALRTSMEQLDIALAQIADLASVYGTDQRSDIEPLTTPTAVLAGELLCEGIGATWMEPAFEGDASLMLVTPSGIALDMHGMARTVLLSDQPGFASFVNQLLDREP